MKHAHMKTILSFKQIDKANYANSLCVFNNINNIRL